ncbi:10139_t:CDS:1, partial [Acaulospora morrowiae]
TNPGWFKSLCYLVYLMVVIIFIKIFVYAIDPQYPSRPADTSMIPYEYQLRYKSHWGHSYVVESSVTEFDEDDRQVQNKRMDNKHSTNIEPKLNFNSRASSRYFKASKGDYSNSQNSCRCQAKLTKRAEIVAHQLTLENFKVFEFRYDRSGNVCM